MRPMDRWRQFVCRPGSRPRPSLRGRQDSLDLRHILCVGGVRPWRTMLDVVAVKVPDQHEAEVLARRSPQAANPRPRKMRRIGPRPRIASRGGMITRIDIASP